MARQTLIELQKKIAALEAQAAKLRDSERAGVIAKIKVAIEAYDIVPNELFGEAKSTKSKSKSKISVDAKFVDGKGNEWVGRGPHPDWLRKALKSGKKLSDFAVGGAKANGAVKPAAKNASQKGAAKKAAKKPLPPKYKDGAGNSWTGRGSQPRWLRAAIAGGKKAEEFLV